LFVIHRSNVWVKDHNNWVDPEDGFDYKKAAASNFTDGNHLPPTLYLTGQGDMALGHRSDVLRFVRESYPNLTITNSSQNPSVFLPSEAILAGMQQQQLQSKRDDFLNEFVSPQFRILSKEAGYKHDYDHINILTHKDAAKDHFPSILNWLRFYSQHADKQRL